MSVLARAEGEETTPKAADLRVAAERFDQGTDAFKAGAFGEAAEHFEAADARAPSVSALMLAMRSRAEAGQFAKALSLAELLLARDSGQLDALEQARSLVSARAPEFGLLEITCQPRCDLVVDRRLAHGQSRSTWRIYVEPGKHELTASFADERTAEGQVTVERGQNVPLTLVAPNPRQVAPKALSQPEAKTPSSSEPAIRRGWSPAWFWLGVSATAVVGGITIWSGIDTMTNPGVDEVRESCAGQGTDCDLYQEGQSKELRTNLLLGGTAVLALSTVAIGVFATDFSGSAPQTSRGSRRGILRPAVAMDPRGGAWFGAEGRF